MAAFSLQSSADLLHVGIDADVAQGEEPARDIGKELGEFPGLALVACGYEERVRATSPGSRRAC